MATVRDENERENRQKQHLDSYFSKLEKKHGKASNLQVLIHSNKLGINYRYPADNQIRPYHIASIGKVFTATLLFMLIERGLLRLDDPIASHLPGDLLKGLFVYQGADYADRITVRDLVAHTSGASDYFEDRVVSGQPFMQEVTTNPDTLWTPLSLLDFSRIRQQAVGQPGSFHYSDTGYILLGLLIEKVTGKPFHENLQEEIFKQLGMKDSWLMFYSEPESQPQKQIGRFWLNGMEASTFRSVSCDWSGGGIASTMEDLLKFQTALQAGRLVSDRTLQMMEVCPNRFRTGIYYGLGMMEIHFEEFFFLLKGLPRVTGHIGILSTHMFYDRATDTHIIMNFGNTGLMTDSFKALIEIMSTIRRR